MLPFPIISNTNVLPSAAVITKFHGQSDHVGLLYSNGDLYTRGSGQYGKLGNGDSNTNYYSNFIKVLTNVKDFYCFNNCTLALKNDGTYWHCGKGDSIYGFTSTNTVWGNCSSLFSSISMNNIKDIQSGEYSTLVLLSTGELYCIGMNSLSELGRGNSNAVTSLTLVRTGVNSISLAYGTSFYILSTGELYGAGYNSGGLYGNGSTATSSTFIRSGTSLWNKVYSRISNTFGFQVGASTSHGTGSGTNGQLGNGASTNSASFLPSGTISGTPISQALSSQSLTNIILTSTGLYAVGPSIVSGTNTAAGTNITTYKKCVVPFADPSNWNLVKNICIDVSYNSFFQYNNKIYCTGGARFLSTAQITFVELNLPI